MTAGPHRAFGYPWASARCRSAARQPERVGAMAMLPQPLATFRSLRKIWADSGYSGPDFAGWVGQYNPRTEVEILKRLDSVDGFQVLPRRWVVERTFVWLAQCRRLVRDYEHSAAAAWIYVALIRIMLRRLT